MYAVAIAVTVLVANQDVLDLVLLEQGVVDVQHSAARITKEIFHALVCERANEHFTAG